MAAPVLDYEYDGPDELADDYDACRPDFDETGSPRLPMGLNVGAQLFWMFNRHTDIAAQTNYILTYPQYWSARLTGVAATEVSSLGCHTDLWCPFDKRFSSLVDDQGWKPLMAPVRRAADILGPITANVAALTGIDPATPVACGIHDSNASLFPHLRSRKAPFSVVSTGTWVISMSIGLLAEGLDPSRDTLVNVDAFGQPVPTARFMGGREFELLMKGRRPKYQPEDIDRVLAMEFMRLPSMETRSGPFQGVVGSWTTDQTLMSAGEYCVTVSFYLGLMTATGLADTRAEGPVLVEGPFADNRAYLNMLASATGRPVYAISGTGTSKGAALLLTSGDHQISQRTDAPVPIQPSSTMSIYAETWQQQVID
ncbi:MAG: carbohydrate kinase [Aestuariibacter sp.]|nr:carbohydrate kinase [Aestuariibacter sp.]